MAKKIKFTMFGIKVNGKLHKAGYYLDGHSQAIKVWSTDHLRFPAEVNALFAVTNNTDIMTDYFEKDRFVVHSRDPFYPEVKDAMERYNDYRNKVAERSAARRAARARAKAQV